MDALTNSRSSRFPLERRWPTGFVLLVAVPVVSLFGAVEVYVAGIIYRAGGAAALNGAEPVSLTVGTSLAMAFGGWVAVAVVCGPLAWLAARG